VYRSARRSLLAGRAGRGHRYLDSRRSPQFAGVGSPKPHGAGAGADSARAPANGRPRPLPNGVADFSTGIEKRVSLTGDAQGFRRDQQGDRCSVNGDFGACGIESGELHSTAVDKVKKASIPRLGPAPASSSLNGCGNTRSISEPASMHTSGFTRATQRGYSVLLRAIDTVTHAKPTDAATARTP